MTCIPFFIHAGAGYEMLCYVVFWVVYVIIIHHTFPNIVNNCMKVATVMHGTEMYILQFSILAFLYVIMIDVYTQNS